MNLLISVAIAAQILLKLDRFVHSLAPAIGAKMPLARSVDRLEYRIIIPTKTQKRSDLSIKANRYQKS